MTVLVLTPTLGGFYFGELLASLTREISGAGGRLVIVETLYKAPSDDSQAPGDFAVPVAWSEVDGVVSIHSAVQAPYLLKLRDAGRPVVLLGGITANIDAPTVMPDNHAGTITAVEHLIGHGHTRIGFVGNLSHSDIRDRFDAYQLALEAHNLDCDPRVVFNALDNMEAGGQQAARDLLACAVRPTAVMVATDRNALGLISTLTDAEMTLPADLAIVAFDNIEAAAFTIPSLSSTSERFAELGALAGRLIMAAIRGDVVPNSVYTLKSVVLKVRTSCGCPDGKPFSQQFTGDRPPATSPDLVHDELLDELFAALVSGDNIVDGPTHDALLAAIGTVERLLTSSESVTDADIRSLTLSIRRLTSRPDALHRIIDAVLDYTERIAVPGVHTTAFARIKVALSKVKSGEFLRQLEATESAFAEQYVVDAGMLDSARTQPTSLDWLAGTHIKAGALALWADPPSNGLLDIVGTYAPGRELPNLVGAQTPAENFPPAPLLDLLVAADGDICVVVPVRTATRDWGLLAIVGAVDSAAMRETYRHWAGMLGVALESQRLQAEVRKSALHDALTGLPNRRLFLERLTAAIARWQRSQTPFAVLFLDLDGFKLINDSLGHPMGDRVLAAVGDRIGRELRTVDTGARFGGDEFAILLEDTDPAGALSAARRVQAALTQPLEFDGIDVSVKASMGITTSSLGYTTGEDTLRDADTAMYRAKAEDPGAIAFFDEETRAHAVQQQVLHAEIDRALDEHQFEVFYQPIVNLSSGRTDRFEALVRWRHPDRGLLLPEEFLPVMETNGLIIELGYWILDQVCQQLAQWGPRVVNVAVNLSDREFWHKDLLPHVLDIVKRHHLSPDRLALEITEGVLMRRPEAALHTMQELHDAGLRLHIDDFGTGYSSLETLHRFPVDAFKIDRSFLQSLASGDHTSRLMIALVGLGKSLGLAVVAEGVETGEQLTFLQSIGCATGQGYLFMPAVNSDDAADLLDLDLSDQLRQPGPSSRPREAPSPSRGG
ncbi:EAL domain-containing protein [Demequina lutea]|nr:EAL domain-containing protein [Demequina lutea]